MSDDIDDILKRVAAGELSPEEAVRQLDAARRATPAATSAPIWQEAPTGPRQEDAPTPGRDGVSAIRITASYRNLDVIADPSVDTAFADGEHNIGRDGDVFVVDGRGDGLFGAASVEDSNIWRFAVNAAIPRGRAIARGWWDHALTVRVNPHLPLQIEALGSKMRLRRGEGGATLQAVACSVSLEGIRGPLRIDTASSSIKGSMMLSGNSRITAEQSSIKTVLLPGSDVRIKVHNRMSKIVLPEKLGRSRMIKQEWAEGVLGAGTGELILDAMMSSIMLGAEHGNGSWV